MDNNVFIDKDTFEIHEDYSKVFICDKEIAYAVALLNKKRYITKSSCEGHIEFTWHEIDNCDLDLLEQAKNDGRFIILKIKETGFDYLTPNMNTSIYISFKTNYDFLNLPEGFNLENDSGCIIRKTIEYNQKGIKRTINDLEKEKNKYINILNEWVKQLPVNNHFNK